MKKKLVYSALFVLALARAQAQVVVIPDANFKAALIAQGVDANSNGQIERTEAESVRTIDVSFRNPKINDLTGLQDFKNLKVLAFSDQNVSTLDISKNTQLLSLVTTSNPLQSLDISKNVSLTTLICQGNLLTSLDLTSNTKLKTLRCDNNQLANLAIKNSADLINFSCRYNLLTEMDLSHNNQLGGGVDLRYNPVLSTICINTSQIAQTTNWYKDATAEWTTECDSAVPSSNIITDVNFRKELIKQGIDINNDRGIQLEEALLVDTLQIASKSIYNLDGLQYFANLVYLDCSDNHTTGLSVLTMPNLAFLKCSNANIFELDLFYNTNLTHLDCSNNHIYTLDLFANPNLVKVFCHSNNMVYFKVSKYKNQTLRTLVITNNKLKSLNLKTSTYLDKLWCYNNTGLTEVCVADVAKAQNSSDYKKDSFATWTNNCGWVPREGAEMEEELTESAMTLYPNPAKEMITVHTKEAVTNISVKSLDGALLLQTADSKQIDIKGLSSGVYLVEIHTLSATEKRKLVVE